MILLSLIAQGVPPDISGVDPVFVKSFLIMTAFVAAVWGGKVWGGRASGKAEDPVHHKQPFIVKEEDSFADKKGTAKAIHDINSKVDAMARENLRSMNHMERELNTLILSGTQRGADIIQAIADMETRITGSFLKEIKDLHLRINPLAEASRGHATDIETIKSRMGELWDWIRQHLPKRRAS